MRRTHVDKGEGPEGYGGLVRQEVEDVAALG
jgi:hypothetical protein